MATRTPTKIENFKREPYKQNPLARATSAAPAWAWGCERCAFGVVTGTTNTLCTCQAGQVRGRWATGNMAPLDSADDIVVPTINAAYGGAA